MSRNRKYLVVIGVFLAIALVCAGPFIVTLSDDTKPDQKVPTLDAASLSAGHFLSKYVDANGRVVRHDQGGDTTSQAQAYAMLLTVATGDRQRFDAIWNWTQTNLLQSDGLFISKWKDGKAVDLSSDRAAGLDIARALNFASVKFGNPIYKTQGDKAQIAIVSQQQIGNSDQPINVNSIWSSVSQERLITQFASDRKKLISDWIVVENGEARPAVNPTVSQSEKRQGKYSVNAQEFAVKLVASCPVNSRDELAKNLWSTISRSKDARIATTLNLDGSIVDKKPSALAAVASAAVAKSAQDMLQVNILLDTADQIERDNSTYLGAAWAALGRVVLTTDWLKPCSFW